MRKTAKCEIRKDSTPLRKTKEKQEERLRKLWVMAQLIGDSITFSAWQPGQEGRRVLFMTHLQIERSSSAKNAPNPITRR